MDVMAMKGWSWVRVGQRLREWMTPGAKSRALEIVLDDYEGQEQNWEALEAAGVKLDKLTTDEDEQYSDDDDSDDSDDDEVIDLVDELGHLRRWDEGQGRKRTAKEILHDLDETEENIQAAREWIEQNTKKLAKTTVASRRKNLRRQGKQQGTGRKQKGHKGKQRTR